MSGRTIFVVIVIFVVGAVVWEVCYVPSPETVEYRARMRQRDREYSRRQSAEVADGWANIWAEIKAFPGYPSPTPSATPPKQGGGI